MAMVSVSHDSLKARNTARLLVTLAVVAAHFSFAILDMVDRLSFTVGSKYDVIQEAADSSLWLPINLFCGVLIVMTLGHNRLQRKALSLSFATMGTWSFFTLIWGLYPISKVSLAGPILGLIVATIAQFVSLSYSGGDQSERQG